MKTPMKYFFALAALALGACSSMEPDDANDRYVGVLPDDFNLAEFSEINPDVAASQVAAYIRFLNTRWTDSLKLLVEADTLLALRQADSLAYMTDTVQLAKIKTDYLNQAWKGMDSLSKNELSALIRFNILGRADEYAYAQSYLENDLDSNAIVQTYLYYGMKEGRAYRKCTDSDAKKRLKSISLPGVVTGSVINYSAYSFCLEDESVAAFYVIEEVSP